MHIPSHTRVDNSRTRCHPKGVATVATRISSETTVTKTTEALLGNVRVVHGIVLKIQVTPGLDRGRATIIAVCLVVGEPLHLVPALVGDLECLVGGVPPWEVMGQDLLLVIDVREIAMVAIGIDLEVVTIVVDMKMIQAETTGALVGAALQIDHQAVLQIVPQIAVCLVVGELLHPVLAPVPAQDGDLECLVDGVPRWVVAGQDLLTLIDGKNRPPVAGPMKENGTMPKIVTEIGGTVRDTPN